MLSVDINEMQRDLLNCLSRVRAGETVVIVQEGSPIMELKPIAAAEINRRPFGLAAGEFSVPDDFDAPLPEDVLRRFEGT